MAEALKVKTFLLLALGFTLSLHGLQLADSIGLEKRLSK